MTRDTSKAEHAVAEHTSAQVHSRRDQTTTKAAPIMPNASQNSHTTNTQVPAHTPRDTVPVSDHSVTPAAVQKTVSPANQDHTHPRTPVQTTRPDATSRRTPAHAAKPDVTPQRNRGVSAAVRPDISPVSAQNPTVKPQQNRSKLRNPTSSGFRLHLNRIHCAVLQSRSNAKM